MSDYENRTGASPSRRYPVHCYTPINAAEADYLAARADASDAIANPNIHNVNVACIRHGVPEDHQRWHAMKARERDTKRQRNPLKRDAYVASVLRAEWRAVATAEDPAERLRRAARNLARFADRELDLFDLRDALEKLGLRLGVDFPAIDDALAIVSDAAVANA